MTRRHRDENYSTSPFYDVEFASRHGAEAITLRCRFSVLGMPDCPGTMTLWHGSDFVVFVSDDGRHRTHVRLDALRASFQVAAPAPEGHADAGSDD